MARSLDTMVNRETTSKETRDSLSFRICDAMNLAKSAELRTLYIQYMRFICSLYYTSGFTHSV